MSSLAPILQAIEFIEDHLQDELRIADVADAALYSVFHFCRIFNATTHHSPYDYLMRRRLSEAGRSLVETDRKIIDIAFDFQFNNPETFSRAFRRMFDASPRQWRAEGRLDQRVLLPRLTDDHLAYRSHSDFETPVLEERGQTQVMGVMQLVGAGFAALPSVWDTLRREFQTHAGRTSVSGYYGIISYPEWGMADDLFYMAAAELAGPVAFPSMLVAKVLPAGRYVRMVHAGNSDTLHLGLDYLYHTWLPQKGMRPSSPFTIEAYGSHLRLDGPREILIPIA